MIGLQVFRHVPTGLEINGPILKFSEDPSSTLVPMMLEGNFIYGRNILILLTELENLLVMLLMNH